MPKQSTNSMGSKYGNQINFQLSQLSDNWLGVKKILSPLPVNLGEFLTPSFSQDAQRSFQFLLIYVYTILTERT